MDARYLDEPAAHWAQLLASGDPIDRRLGAYALGEIGPAAAGMTDQLADALQDPVSFVRVWAAGALAKVDPSHRQASETLVEATQDEQSFVRSLAVWMLGRLGPEPLGAEAAIAALARCLTDEDPSVRVEAEHALARLSLAPDDPARRP